MKAIFFAVITMMLTLPLAHADLVISGEVISAPATVKVRADDGTISEYKTPVISKRGYLYADAPDSEYKGVSLSWGNTTRCAPYIGQLAEAIAVTIQAKDGSVKTTVIQAATVGPEGNNDTIGNARVFGTCGGDSNQLTEISINTTLHSAKIQ